MKCITPKMYLCAGAFIALVAVYIGFTMLRNTYEGLGNSADSGNIIIIEKTKKNVDVTNEILKTLPGDPTTYINLLTSYKNNAIATILKRTVDTKNTVFKISEYDEAIDYLKTLGVSGSVIDNPSIESIIIANNTATNAILSDLTADNQAYIDLLTSYKNNAIASGILNISKSVSMFAISEYNYAIEYLRTLGGIVLDQTPHVPTTKNISLAPP